METTNLSTLKIHRLTENQYKRELAAGRIDETAIYLTPETEYQDLGEITGYDSFNVFANTLIDEGKYRFDLGGMRFYLITIREHDSAIEQFEWDTDDGVQYMRHRHGTNEHTGEWEFDDWSYMFHDTIRYTSQYLTSSQKEMARDNIGAAPDFSTNPITATSTDGVAYTATVNGLSELYVGCSLMIVPNITSTSSSAVTLNVNNLGSVQIKRWDNISTSEWWGFPIAGWMKAGYPIRVKYTGVYWIIEGMSKTYATDLTGTVPIANGGTGYGTIEDTTYTTARYRASALVSAETNPSTNGVINWTYE